MEYFPDESKFLDPADWNVASYNAHPVDVLEPIVAEANTYRDAAPQLLGILTAVDSFMAQSTDPRLAWIAISCTLELTSTSKLTETEIARQIGVSELRVRRAVGKFTRLADVDSSSGLRALGQIRSNGGPPSKETAGAGSNGSFEVPVEAGEMTGLKHTTCPHLTCSAFPRAHPSKSLSLTPNR